MTLSDFQSEVLSTLNDPDGDWTTTTRVKDALNLCQDELLAFLNPRVIEDMCPDLIGVVSTNTTSGVAVYNLPDDFVRAYSVYIDGYPATEVPWSRRMVVDGTNSWTAATAADPAFSVLVTAYYVYPTPSSVVSISFTYVKPPTRLSSGTDTTDFGIEFDEILLDLLISFLLKKPGTMLVGGEQGSIDHRQRALDSIEVINKRYA